MVMQHIPSACSKARNMDDAYGPGLNFVKSRIGFFYIYEKSSYMEGHIFISLLLLSVQFQ